MAEERLLETNETGISRRKFLVGTGAVLGGLAAGSLLSFNFSKAQAATALPLPFPSGGFTPTDLENIRQRSFEGYHAVNCCYGAAKGLLDTLKEKLPGTGWDDIPLDMFKWGGGGGLAWGTICGALNGVLPIVNLLVPWKPTNQVNAFADALLSWYTGFDFPTKELDSWLTDRVFTTTTNGVTTTTVYNFPNQTKSISDSPLCHNSVSIWCAKSGATVGSNAKKARCGKLTGDVGVKTAELLNAYFLNNTSPAAVPFNAATADCMDCHTGTGNNQSGQPKLDDEQGKMTCGECHSDGGKNAAPGCKPLKAL